MIVKVVIPDSIYARVYFARGEQGPQGPQGIQGTPGATGATGPPGPAGANGTSYTPGDPIYVTVRNATGSVLNKGTIVYTSGANGIHTQVTPANNSSDATSARTLGWMAETVQNNSEGLCMVEGYLEGLATNGLTEGAQLYLSNVPGGFTQTKPVAPNHLVYVGVVAKASAGNGKVYVKVQNGYELDELHDVRITSPANNEVLTYESSTGLWKNKVNAADGVTSITATAPLTGGTITSTGSIGLDQTALSITQSQVTNLVSDLAAKAPSASPTFTGTVTTPVTSGTLLWTDSSGVLGKVGNAPGLGYVPYTASVTGGIAWQLLSNLAKTDVGNAFTGAQTMTGSAAGSVVLTLAGAAGQTANLLSTAGGARIPAAGNYFIAPGITATYTADFSAGAASVTAVVIKGASGQTADLLQFQNSAGTYAGGFERGGALNIQPTAAVNGYSLMARTTSPTVIPVMVRGAASQSANLQEWQNSAGTILGSIDSSGQLRSPSVLNVNSFNNARIRLLDAGTVIDTGIAGNVALKLQNTNASPTGNITEWLNSAGSVRARIASNGDFKAFNIASNNSNLQIFEANSGGVVLFGKSTAQQSSPGTGFATLYLRDGTNAGTLKLVVRAGTAGAETTILDNIPQT